MEINSSNITQVQQSQVQPQQQQVADRRAFEEEIASQEQEVQQSVESTPTQDESQIATTDYTNLIREAQAQQAAPNRSAQAFTANQTQDVQSAAITAYQNNQENYEAPTASGELLPRVDAIV